MSYCTLSLSDKAPKRGPLGSHSSSSSRVKSTVSQSPWTALALNPAFFVQWELMTYIWRIVEMFYELVKIVFTILVILKCAQFWKWDLIPTSNNTTWVYLTLTLRCVPWLKMYMKTKTTTSTCIRVGKKRSQFQTLTLHSSYKLSVWSQTIFNYIQYNLLP